MTIRTVRLVRTPRSSPVLASYSQQAFWEFEEVLQGEPVFNIVHAMRVRGRLDTGVLERALTLLVARHEPLRTTFASSGGGGGDLHQVIAEASPVSLIVHEVSGGWPAAAALAAEHARARFTPSEQPLRPYLYRVGADEHLLSLDFHHAAVDAWSLEILWEELWTAHGALRDGRDPQLPELAFDYADFSVWYRSCEPQLREDLAYWRALVADGIPVLELPVDRPRSAATRYHGAHREISLAPAIGALARRHDASPWMVYLAAFQAMLHRATGQTDFGIGTPVSTLTRAQRAGVVGPFLNLVVVRADVSGAPSFLELLARVRQAARDTWVRRFVPWSWVEPLGPPSAPGVSPHFQVMFNLIDGRPGLHPAGVELTPAGIEIGAVEFDLSLTIFEREDGALATLEYKTGLFDPDTVARLIAELDAVLAAAVADPRQPVARR